MKTIKSYFNEENRLNKGYRNACKKKLEKQDNVEIMSLEGLGDMSQESLKHLIEIAKKEQEHQHNIEKSQIRSKNIFRYFLLLSLIVITLILSVFSFFIIALSSFVGSIFVIFSFGAVISIASYFRMSTGKNYKQKNDTRYYKA